MFWCQQEKIKQKNIKKDVKEAQTELGIYRQNVVVYYDDYKVVLRLYLCKVLADELYTIKGYIYTQHSNTNTDTHTYIYFERRIALCNKE